MGLYKRGKTWYTDVYDVNGMRYRRAVGSNKKLSEKVLNKIKTEIVENRFLNINKKKKIKFEALVNRYLEYAKDNKRSWDRDERSLRTLSKSFGGKFICDIGPYQIENYKSMRRREVSPASVNRELACLKHMFNLAVEWELLERNPVNKVKLFREDNRRDRYLEKDEIARLYDTCSDYLKPIVMTAVNTGMRKSEILKLKWEDVDLKKRMINVKDSKNDSFRQIPIGDDLMITLQALKFKSPYVFAREDGKPPICIKTTFKNALKRGEIQNFRFHDLRHTFASHLAMSGASLMTIKELMGHKTITMTLRYSHLSPDHNRDAVNSLKFFDSHNMVTKAPLGKTLTELSA